MIGHALQVEMSRLRHRFELFGHIRGQHREIDRLARKSDLARLGARQREQLIDQPRQPVDFLDLACRAFRQLGIGGGERSASSISPRSAVSGVRNSWASAELNCFISPTAPSRRARVSLKAVATSSS